MRSHFVPSSLAVSTEAALADACKASMHATATTPATIFFTRLIVVSLFLDLFRFLFFHSRAVLTTRLARPYGGAGPAVTEKTKRGKPTLGGVRGGKAIPFPPPPRV